MAHLVQALALALAVAAGCGSRDATLGGAAAGAAGAAGDGGVIDPGRCGDGACLLAAGENSGTCPADCGAPAPSSAKVRFFADFNSKAVEYGQKLRFTYVVWNEGSQDANNVVLPVPIVQNASTDIYGARHFCETGGQRYDCMVDLSYVPGSMRINRVYHPSRARNSVPWTAGRTAATGFARRSKTGRAVRRTAKQMSLNRVQAPCRGFRAPWAGTALPRSARCVAAATFG